MPSSQVRREARLRIVRSAGESTLPRTSTLSTSQPSRSRRPAIAAPIPLAAGNERRATLAAHMSIPPLTSQVAPVMNED
jgi:hypothetical protein